jgi:hypothetical protein
MVFFSPTTLEMNECCSAIHERPPFLSGLSTRNERSTRSIAHLYMTIGQSVHGGHSCMSKTETGNRRWMSIILNADVEAPRGGCHRRLGLKNWRQLSRRADPASSATAIPTSSTIMELCIVLVLTSFRRSESGKLDMAKEKGQYTHLQTSGLSLETWHLQESSLTDRIPVANQSDSALPAQPHLRSQRRYAPHLLAVVHGAPNRASRAGCHPLLESERRLKCGGPLKRREWKGHLIGANMNTRLRKRKRGDIRVSMEPRTTKDTMGWRAVARRSCWDDGGLCGTSRRLWARVEMKTAPTPI